MLGWIQLGNKRINLDVVREIEVVSDERLVIRWANGDQRAVEGVAARRLLAKFKTVDLEKEPVKREAVKLSELPRRAHRPSGRAN